jgi:hypothetical protein
VGNGNRTLATTLMQQPLPCFLCSESKSIRPPHSSIFLNMATDLDSCNQRTLKDSKNKKEMLPCSSIFSATTVRNTQGSSSCQTSESSGSTDIRLISEGRLWPHCICGAHPVVTAHCHHDIDKRLRDKSVGIGLQNSKHGVQDWHGSARWSLELRKAVDGQRHATGTKVVRVDAACEPLCEQHCNCRRCDRRNVDSVRHGCRCSVRASVRLHA